MIDSLDTSGAVNDEWEKINEDTFRLAVPGGWIYRISSVENFSTTFVPFSSEVIEIDEHGKIKGSLRIVGRVKEMRHGMEKDEAEKDR